MQDKHVRRRRAVLALLILASLVLLTAYFGESQDSPLHSVQRGVDEVFAPVQSGASKVLSPVRDIAGWISGTINAKSENAKLEQENHKLTYEYDHARYAQLQNQTLSGLLHLDASDNLDQYGLLTAHVIAQNNSYFYEGVEIDQGSDDGVRVDDPVISTMGLVGDVSTVGPTYAIVTELFGAKYGVGAEVEDRSQDTGLLEPAVGSPDSLILTELPTHDTAIAPGQPVVTSGFADSTDPALRSKYPPDIPIGTVGNFNENTLLNDQQVTVVPDVNLRHLSDVQVLTKPMAKTVRAGLTAP